MFHSGHNPSSVDGQRPLGIQLHIGIGVAHLSNEQVQQYHNHQEEECQVDDHTKPPREIRHAKLYYIYSHTRTTHAYDALRCSKRHAARMGRAAQVSGIARLVGVQRAIQKNSNMKSEPKYLAFEESPIHAFFFTYELFLLLLLSLYWLLRWADFFAFFWSHSRQLSAAFSTHLCTWLRKYIRRKGPAGLSSPSSIAKKHRPDVIM